MIRSSLPVLALVWAFAFANAVQAGPPDAAAPLHDAYGALLSRYVHEEGVDYVTWVAEADDVAALDTYVDSLSALDPTAWPRADGLAYWLNLYNAATLRLILHHYPLESIKDLGGFLKKSPWKRHAVTVAGRKLSLDDIENDVIRPTYSEPRIHFALNCASVGCPPLQPWAYVPEKLDKQMDAACRFALRRAGWVRVDGEHVAVTKIFDWYEDDFARDGGTVTAFINRFRDTPLPQGSDFSYLPYDWSLNEVR